MAEDQTSYYKQALQAILCWPNLFFALPNEFLENGITKNPEAFIFKASGFCGISRTRTYDPHDVNVVL